MVRIELIPTLEHCIETTARQEFSRSAAEYMKRGEEDGEFEERIELLKMFLEASDFKKLRSESEKHLTEGRTVKYILYKEKGKLKYEMRLER